MLEFFSKLFDTSDFPPRWNCGHWTEGHGWLHILSDLGVWSAYVAIPCVLVYFAMRRRNLPFRLIFLLFGAFILACGTTHLMEAIIFWWPAYRLAGVIKLVTAVVSWATVVALVPIVPKVLAMRSPDELEREIEARRLAEIQLHRANSELEKQLAALRSSEQRFRFLVEGTKDYAIFLLDPQGVVASWNPGAERIKQYKPEEIIGKHFSQFYREEDVKAEKPKREIEAAIATGRYEEEGWRVRKDGSLFWANVILTTLFDEAGNHRGFLKVTRDMTDRRETEAQRERLLEEEAARKAAEEISEKLRVTLESIGDGVVTTDDQGNVTSMNPVAQVLTGWGDEAVGKPLTEVFHIINEYSRQTVENPVARVLREGVVVGLANHTLLISKDGTERPIDDSAAPIRGHSTPIRGVILVFRDASERRKSEDELLLSEQRLQVTLAELREADRRKDEFLAMLAHELRNPLAPLRNALEIMRLSGGEPGAIEESRTLMERQLHHMVRLVDDLLDLSRISRGKVELRRERVDLEQVMRSAVDATRHLIDDKRHTLTLNVPEQPMTIDGDVTRLVQIFSNLLNNAAKYSEPGGRIEFTAERQGSDAVIHLRDNGIGIAPNMLGTIFDMFTQADRSLERVQGGLGIGLTLVQRLVEMHGGTVEAHSEGEGQGSEFVVRLPLMLDASRLQEPTDHQPATNDQTTSCRILVVDDNRDAATSLGMMLRLMGNEVLTAHDGFEALEAAERERPHLVLLDIGLPKMSGYDVARKIREQSWGKDMVLVALTGWGQQEDRQRSHDAGFDRHLVKPVEPGALQTILKSMSPNCA